MTYSENDPPTIVRSYHDAWTSGDIDRALGYVSEDARCFAPDDDVSTKDDWHRYLSGFVPMLTGAPAHAEMTDGNRVALWYFPQTAVTETTLACELFSVEDGVITEIRLVFDRLSYLPPGQRSA